MQISKIGSKCTEAIELRDCITQKGSVSDKNSIEGSQAAEHEWATKEKMNVAVKINSSDVVEYEVNEKRMQQKSKKVVEELSVELARSAGSRQQINEQVEDEETEWKWANDKKEEVSGTGKHLTDIPVSGDEELRVTAEICVITACKVTENAKLDKSDDIVRNVDAEVALKEREYEWKQTNDNMEVNGSDKNPTDLTNTVEKDLRKIQEICETIECEATKDAQVDLPADIEQKVNAELEVNERQWQQASDNMQELNGLDRSPMDVPVTTEMELKTKEESSGTTERKVTKIHEFHQSADVEQKVNAELPVKERDWEKINDSMKEVNVSNKTPMDVSNTAEKEFRMRKEMCGNKEPKIAEKSAFDQSSDIVQKVNVEVDVSEVEQANYTMREINVSDKKLVNISNTAENDLSMTEAICEITEFKNTENVVFNHADTELKVDTEVEVNEIVWQQVNDDMQEVNGSDRIMMNISNAAVMQLRLTGLMGGFTESETVENAEFDRAAGIVLKVDAEVEVQENYGSRQMIICN